MLFYFLFFFDSFKRLILFTNLFLVLQSLTIKLLTLLVLAITLYLLLHIPDSNKIKTRFKKLSKLRNFRINFLDTIVKSYRISKLNPIRSTMFILGVITYISIFIFGILFIKIHNTKMELDLKTTFETFLEKIGTLSLIDKTIVILAAVTAYLVFITAFYKIKNLFNKPIFAVHYYLCLTEWYPKLYIEELGKILDDRIVTLLDRNLNKVLSFMALGKIPLYNPKTKNYDNLTDLETGIYRHNKTLIRLRKCIYISVSFSIKKIPTLLILLGISVDLAFNNFILHYTFYCYPLAHTLQIWLNLCAFRDQRSFMLDDEVRDLIYHSFSNNPQDVVTYMLNEFKSNSYLDYKDWERRTNLHRRNKRKVKIRKILKKLTKLLKTHQT